MSRSPERDRYRPRAQRQWHRVDAEWAPQGHALQTMAASGTYYAWQDRTNGPFWVMRTGAQGDQSKPVQVPDFTAARIAVTQADATIGGRPLSEKKLQALAASQYRQANPETIDPDVRTQFITRGGIGAFFGAITGALIGGAPGILLGNTPVASVGAHVGGIMGAAAGAYVGTTVDYPKPATDPDSVHEIKKRVLR